MSCQDCGKKRRIVAYGRCAACMTFLDTCARCGEDLHLHFTDVNLGHRFIAQQREVARRSIDGDADGTSAGDGGAERDDSVRRGSDDDVAVLAESMVRSGDEVVAEMKRIQGKLDAAFPLLTEFRDRMRALEARR